MHSANGNLLMTSLSSCSFFVRSQWRHRARGGGGGGGVEYKTDREVPMTNFLPRSVLEGVWLVKYNRS